MQDVTDAGENFRDFRVEKTVRVGNDANLHVIGGTSYTSPQCPQFQNNQGLV